MASSMEVQPSSNVSDTVLASSGSSGSVSVALHPLVIMNISEHYTRIKAQDGKPDPQGRFAKFNPNVGEILHIVCDILSSQNSNKNFWSENENSRQKHNLYPCYILLNVFQCYYCFSVIGALLGTQDGRKIEIFNSFELKLDSFDDGQIVLNMEYYSTKEEQCKL